MSNVFCYFPPLHLRMEATVLIRTHQRCRHFSVPFPRSVPRYHPVLEVYRQFLGLHGLVCALTCTEKAPQFYRQVCAFPNHVQSTEFNISGLQLSCTNISRIISGNRMHLSSILCHGKGCEYLRDFYFINQYIGQVRWP